MIGGVNFQPGGGPDQAQGQRPPSGSGVQEAIRVLSLRLPKVVGAQGLAPQALLTSPGSDGNSRIDSVVSQVMARMFPSGPAQPTAPHVPSPFPSGEDVSSSMPLPRAPYAPNVGNDVRPLPSQQPNRPAPSKPAPRITPGYELPDVLSGLGGMPEPPPLTWPSYSTPEPQRPDFF
jgi:hypothetical protein